MNYTQHIEIMAKNDLAIYLDLLTGNQVLTRKSLAEGSSIDIENSVRNLKPLHVKKGSTIFVDPVSGKLGVVFSVVYGEEEIIKYLDSLKSITNIERKILENAGWKFANNSNEYMYIPDDYDGSTVTGAKSIRRVLNRILENKNNENNT